MDDFLGRNNGQMQCRGMLHIVEAGDTLYKIARKYGVPLSRVIYANPYVNVYNLQVGDEICVPVMMPRMPAQNPAAARTDQTRMMPGSPMGGAAPGMPNSQIGQPETPGSPMGNGAMPGVPMGNGAMPGVPMGNGAMPDVPMGNGAMPDVLMGNRAMPGVPMGNGTMPGSPMGNGAVPGGLMGSGVMPVAPDGRMEDGTFSEMPDRQMEGMRSAVTDQERADGAFLEMPDRQMERAMPDEQTGRVMPDGRMEGAVTHDSTGNLSDSSPMEAQRNESQEKTQENWSERRMVLPGVEDTDARNHFAEMQESEKLQQSEEVQHAFEHASASACSVKAESMPWENTVVTESMMEDYLSVSR